MRPLRHCESQVERTEKVALPPKEFGGDIHAKVVVELKKKFEGRCSAKWGYTLFVFPGQDGAPVTMSAGILDIDTGCAVFDVKFTSMVFRPFNNEVMLAEVLSVSPVRCQVCELTDQNRTWD
jgi:DNA-directed RNA polymerase subunit E'/Rpb7